MKEIARRAIVITSFLIKLYYIIVTQLWRRWECSLPKSGCISSLLIMVDKIKYINNFIVLSFNILSKSIGQCKCTRTHFRVYIFNIFSTHVENDM